MVFACRVDAARSLYENQFFTGRYKVANGLLGWGLTLGCFFSQKAHRNRIEYVNRTVEGDLSHGLAPGEEGWWMRWTLPEGSGRCSCSCPELRILLLFVIV